MSIKIQILNGGKIIDRMGLKPGGKFSNRAVDLVQENMEERLPYRNYGHVVDAARQGKDYPNARIVMNGPAQRYLFEGKAMEGKPKRPTSRNLRYTKSPHPNAGPRYDEYVKRFKIRRITSELQAFVRGG